jgi:CRP/FNR family transcriptional regulator, cyclic AMP receptor protein
MSKESEQIQSIPLFSSLNQRQLEELSLLFDFRSVPKGKTIWWQGEPSDELAFVSQGSLGIEIAGHRIASIPAGQMAGELAVFTHDQRTASVISETEPVKIMCLSRKNLEVLRKVMPNIYDIILDVGLERTASRVNDMGKEIARLASGDGVAPKRTEANALGRWWKKLTGVDTSNPPSGLSSIRKLPRLKNAPPKELQLILSHMVPKFIPKGQALFLEGDTGDSVFLLVDGCIEVKRNVRGGRAEPLANLFSGALFGTGSLLLKERRNAACVAAENTDCWAFELNSEAYKKLKGTAGRIFRESLLFSLAFQLRNADDKLIVLKTGQRPKQSDYDLIRGDLAGFQGRG